MNDDIRKLIDETLWLDREATPGPWRRRDAETENGYSTSAVSPDSEEEDGLSPEQLTIAGRTIALGLSGNDAALIATFRTAAPLLAAEVRRLRAELEETRLTLDAEQGRQEGAPYDNPELVLAMVNGERIRRGLSWRELAAILGVSPSTLTRWTHGKMLSVSAYLRVCKWLNAAINETIDIVDANGPGWCDRCSPDRCDCEDDGTARAAMLAADAATG